MITINVFVLVAIAVIAFLLGWFVRKQMEKIRPDQVANLDRQGNAAVDQSSAAIQAAKERTQAALDRVANNKN